MSKETITIISFTGPSGSGKSELIGSLLELYPDHCTMWQQFTTRKRRGPNDRYVFVSPDKYLAMRQLLTVRTEFGGNFYGTMPEAGSEGKAVLTIADKVGHADLAATVEMHNRNLELNAAEPLVGGQGRPTPLGASRARLFSVKVRYTPTEESVEARGRASRGLAFVQAELDGLEDFAADLTIDTTDEWPDPQRFFDEHVWSLIEPPDWPALAREELARAAELVEAHPEVAEDVHSMLSRWREEFLSPPKQSAVEAMMAEAPLAAIQAQFDALVPPAATQPGDDVVAEVVAATPEVPALVEAFSGDPEDRLARMRAEIESAPPEAPPPPPAPEAEPAPPPPPPAPAQTGPTFKTIRDLVANSDFEDFIIRTRTGQTGFSNVSYFDAMFRRYMTQNGAVFPGVLTFDSSTVADPGDPKKQAKIRNFVATHKYNGQEEIFMISYSERLRRPESGGRVIGSVNLNS